MDDEEEEPKNCFKIVQNRVYCTLGYSSTYIGTPKFLTKVLWVYSHLKSDSFWQNFTKFDIVLQEYMTNRSKVLRLTVQDASNNIRKKLFFCQKSYGKTTQLKFFIVPKIENQFHFTNRRNKSSKENSSILDISSLYLSASPHKSFWPYYASTTVFITINFVWNSSQPFLTF